MHDPILQALEKRLNPLHAHRRIAIENDHHQKIFGGGINFFHPENWYSFHSWMRYLLKCSGVYGRGQQNARQIRLKNNTIHIPHLPDSFNGYTILHISDPHADMDEGAMNALIESVRGLDYRLCVLTGDYRAKTSGPYDKTLAEMQRLCEVIEGPVYAVLGNHDSIRMVPGLEQMGIQMLINESTAIELDGTRIYLSGIDDAHYFQVDDIEEAAENIPHDAVSILLSHTPEIFKKAADSHFDVILCGHTHGGQICLPGGIPLTLDAKCPRFIGSGPWRYKNMVGYTSVGSGTTIVNVRLNCHPEVTLHRLERPER
jgi:predicted MPP superfamily phosphohydrolase